VIGEELIQEKSIRLAAAEIGEGRGIQEAGTMG
jgi:hypothetical protein